MFFQTFVAVLFCAVAVQGKNLIVQNVGSRSLVVSVTNEADITVLAGAAAIVAVPDDFSGTVSAVAVDAEVTGPRTKVELSLGELTDSYAVSLVDGFNLRAKVVPVDTDCPSSTCMANLLQVCPLVNQLTNSLLAVEACSNNGLVFKTICPTAVVSSVDAPQTCAGSLSILILLG